MNLLRNTGYNPEDEIRLAPPQYCNGCTACVSVCPATAIAMKADKAGFFFPAIDASACVGCGACMKACPVLIDKPCVHDVENVLAVVNTDLKIRKRSSSGGVFLTIAKRVIDSGGAVYGAAMDEKQELYLARVDRQEDLPALAGSKYVQANMGSIFKDVKRDLEAGSDVFFTGTPCQVAGLKSYLKKDYAKLLTADLICHGVPSIELFKRYLGGQERKYRAKARSVRFRNKDYGWNHYAMEILFDNGRRYCRSNQQDPWMLSFNENIMLRESCYHCLYKSKERVSDLTLGDLWGIDAVASEMNDNQGVSLVIVQTPKGAQALERIERQFRMKRIDFDVVAPRNSFHQISVHAHRQDFIDLALSVSFNEAYKRYVEEPLWHRCYLNTRLLLSKWKQKLKGRF